MATRQINEVIQHLCRTVLGPEQRMTDGQLLESFISRKDTDAFQALVRRHGPMVFSVCRRLLHNHHDAEDAFQAVFLVLARKASSVKPREMVANWLHGVAQQTARKANAMNAKRRLREKLVESLPEPVAAVSDPWHELGPWLDQELNRLPEKHRLPIILCDLEGKSIKEATRQLGWPQGTLAGRLARGRTTLAKRLARRGVILSGGSLAALLSQNAASASMPGSLVVSTVKAAGLLAAGKAAVGVISPKVAAITEGVMKAMMLTKLKTVATVLLVLGLLSIGVGGVTYTAAAGGQPEAEKQEQTATAADHAKMSDEAAATTDLVWTRLGMKLEIVGPADIAGLRDASRELNGGMRVLAVRPSSPAAKAKIRKGDVLVGLNQWETIGREDVPYTLGYCQGAKIENIRFHLVRNHRLIKGELSLNTDDEKITAAKPEELGVRDILSYFVGEVLRNAAGDNMEEPKAAPPAKVGQIIIVGNEKTAQKVILQQIHLVPGQVLDLPSLREAEKRLAALNQFVVDPKNGVRPTVTIVDPETDTEYKDIVVTVQEK